MQPDAQRSLIQQATQAWITGDVEAFVTLFTHDGEFIVPGNRWVGQSAIRTAFEQFIQQSTDVDIALQRILVEGDTAVIEWHWEDTDRSTGKRNRADDAIVVDFREGLIHRWREYIDTATPSSDQ